MIVLLFSNLPAVVVVSPRSTSEVAECAKVCSKYKLPMVPFGTGTGVEGGVLAVKVELELCPVKKVQTSDKITH